MAVFICEVGKVASVDCIVGDKITCAWKYVTSAFEIASTVLSPNHV